MVRQVKTWDKWSSHGKQNMKVFLLICSFLLFVGLIVFLVKTFYDWIKIHGIIILIVFICIMVFLLSYGLYKDLKGGLEK